MLLAHGADQQVLDCEGRTPCDYAQELENGESVVALLESYSYPPSEQLRQSLSFMIIIITSRNASIMGRALAMRG